MAAPASRPQTVMEPMASAVAGVYVEAMLPLVADNAQAEALAEELHAMVALTDGIEGYADWVGAASPQHQSEIVQRTFSGRCSHVIEGLLSAMARNGRLGLLPLVAEEFRRRLNARCGRVEVTVVTARPLDESHRQAMVRTLRETTGADPLLRTRVEPSVLGGVIVRIGDREYDGSVAGELKRMRQRLKAAATGRMLTTTPNTADRS